MLLFGSTSVAVNLPMEMNADEVVTSIYLIETGIIVEREY